jgi:hypothetical protein
MRPLSLAERWPGQATVSLGGLLTGEQPTVAGSSPVGLADYTRELLVSGFPGLRELPDRLRRAQLEGYVQRIIGRDFPELGHQPRNPAALRRRMTAYAASTATSRPAHRRTVAPTASPSCPRRCSGREDLARQWP